jgi:hypothetical protein
MNRIQLFPRFTPYELPVRWGHTFHSVAKALAKARTLHAHTVEVRDVDKPYSTGLLAIIKGGKNVVAT